MESIAISNRGDDVSLLRIGKRDAILLVGVSLILIFGGLWLAIRNDPLKNTDELKTAERAREMLLLGGNSVHDNFHLSFAKPPLQYWMTAFTLSHWQNREEAARIWPMFYGGLTICALMWLGFLVEPRRPVVMALSAILLLTCPLFLTETSRALLDSGLTFFATLALVFAQLTRKDPRWWLGVAVACSLGTLQKIPLIFVIWLLLVLARLTSSQERAHLCNKWLFVGLGLAIVASLLWPALQYLRFHPSVPDLLGSSQATILTNSDRLGSRPYFEILYQLCGSAWIFGALAIAAAFMALFRQRDRPAFELAVVATGVLFLAIVFNFRSARYILPVSPAFILLLALALTQIFDLGKGARTFAVILVFVVAASGISQAYLKIQSRRENVTDELQIARELGVRQNSGAALILVRAPVARGGLLDLFYLFYGDLRRSIATTSIERLRANPLPPPLLGVCLEREFKQLQAFYPRLVKLNQHGEFILWQISGAPK